MRAWPSAPGVVVFLSALTLAACTRHAPSTEPEPEEVVPLRGRVAPADTMPAPPVAPAAPGEAFQPPDTVESLRDVRVGLLVGIDRAEIGGGDALVVHDADGGFLDAVPEGWTMLLRRDGAGVSLFDADGHRALGARRALVLAPRTPGRFLRLGGKEYRGELWAFAGTTGMTIVNRVGLESYLAGVLSAEMGRREPSDMAALMAQAVVSRTFAVKNLGKRSADGFDLLPTVADQIYGGVASETAQSWEAVRRTRHQVLTYHGEIIDPFFSSTCGGKTAAGVEVFRAADRPYLQARPDLSPTGEAYCSLSPRFRWRQEWTGPELTQTVRRYLPSVAQISERDIETIRDVAITAHTPSGRVAAIAIRLAGRDGGVEVRGPDIRRVLRPGPDRLLLSTRFSLSADHRTGSVARLVADGAGSGHGVGFCQWGAVGRARAGQAYDEILTAYFPATMVESLD